MKKLIYLICSAIFGILAHSTSGTIAVTEYEKANIETSGIEIGGVRVYENGTSTNDLLRAVAGDTSLTAEESAHLNYEIQILGKNPFKDRFSAARLEADKKIENLILRKNIFSFLAAIFGLILIISLFKKDEKSSATSE